MIQPKRFIFNKMEDYRIVSVRFLAKRSRKFKNTEPSSFNNIHIQNIGLWDILNE